MRLTNLYTTLCFLLLVASASAQQINVEPRVAGLEHNEEYMSLLREDNLLQMREDSIAAVIVRTRQLLREDVANRAAYAEQIMPVSYTHLTLPTNVNV